MRKAIVVCGPTASGKTGLSDEISAFISEQSGSWISTLVVDSMQVYKELPIITNQERDRPAELVAITSINDEWTMARHRAATDEVLDRTEGTFVLDAGTGMYLNAILMDMHIAPRVPINVRKEAALASKGASNPRRATREKELEISGNPPRGSIWSESLRFDVTMIYLRPGREAIDSSIKVRSRKIVDEGFNEAGNLKDLIAQGVVPNPSVRSSIGVRELMETLSGALSIEEAEVRISARTRRLARRQIRWFDKLARSLQGRATLITARNVEEIPPLNSMSDILNS